MALTDVNPDPFQLPQYVRQLSFEGGVDELSEPAYVATNSFVGGKNLDIRSGDAETRQGHIFHKAFTSGFDLPIAQLPFDLLQPSTNPPQGAMVYKDAVMGQVILTVVDQQIFLVKNSGDPILMDHPIITTTGEVGMLEAEGRAYLLLGDGSPPLVWTGAGAWTEVADPPPPNFPLDKNSIIAVWFQNRIWQKVGRDAIAASDNRNPESFDYVLNNIRISSGDAGDIVQIIPWRNKDLLILKDDSAWILTARVGSLSSGAQPGTVEIELVSRHGCVAPNTVRVVGADVLYLSNRGVETISRNFQDKAVGVDIPLSSRIQTTINEIRKIPIAKSFAEFFDSRYHLTVPINSDDPDTNLVYDFQRRAWLPRWTELDISRFIIARVCEVDRLLFFKNSGGLFYFYEGHLDNGAFIQTELRTRPFLVNREAYSDIADFDIINQFSRSKTSVFIKGLSENVEEEIIRNERNSLFEDGVINIEEKDWYEDVVVAKSPTSYFRLNESKITATLLDSSGNNNNGIYSSDTVREVEGLLIGDDDVAIRRSGIGSMATGVPPAGFNFTTGRFTASAIVIPHGKTSLSIFADSRTNSDFLFIVSCTFDGKRSKMTVQMGTPGNTETHTSVAFETQFECKYHLAYVYEASAMKFYANGVQIATAPPIITGAITSYQSTNDFNIGEMPLGFTPFVRDVTLDEVIMYADDSFSEASIQTLYQSSIGSLRTTSRKKDTAIIPGETFVLPATFGERNIGKISLAPRKTRDFGHSLRIVNKEGFFSVRHIVDRSFSKSVGKDFR